MGNIELFIPIAIISLVVILLILVVTSVISTIWIVKKLGDNKDLKERISKLEEKIKELDKK